MPLEKMNRYDQSTDYTLYAVTSVDIHIYNNRLGFLPQNLTHYCDLDIYSALSTGSRITNCNYVSNINVNNNKTADM